MLENLLNKFKLLHLLSYVQMFFCCTLHPYFPFHSEQAQTAACPQKPAENTQTNNYTVPWPITTSQTNKNWGGEIEAQKPKTSHATAKLSNFKGRSKTHIPAQIFWWSQFRDSTSPSSGP